VFTDREEQMALALCSSPQPLAGCRVGASGLATYHAQEMSFVHGDVESQQGPPIVRHRHVSRTRFEDRTPG
jgi:hypothetical protein